MSKKWVAVLALLALASVASVACASNYQVQVMLPPGEDVDYDYTAYWTYTGDVVWPQYSGSFEPMWNTVLPCIGGWVTDYALIVKPIDPGVPRPMVDLTVTNYIVDPDPGPPYWDWDLLDNLTVQTTIPGLASDTQDLYMAVNLGQYVNNPNPGLALGSNVQISNGTIAGIQGLKVSTTPFTSDLNNQQFGFSGGTMYTGDARVQCLAMGGVVPEPSSLIALLGGMSGVGGLLMRRRRA